MSIAACTADGSWFISPALKATLPFFPVRSSIVGWLLRISLQIRSELNEELLASTLWDLGTTGLFTDEAGQTVAGFTSEAEAASAGTALHDDPHLDVVVLGVTAAPTAEQWAPSTEPQPVMVDSGGEQTALQILAAGAFGHGGHPTTRLALDLMLQRLGPGDLVLDVGTGTGILAIAAAVAGAGAVIGIDNDQEAIDVAGQNLAANRDLHQTPIAIGPWTVTEALAELGGAADLVVMNVLLPVHRELASEVLEAIAPGGALITAGYLEDQSQSLTSLYCPPAIIHAEDRADGWVCHLLVTREQSP